MTRRLIWRDAVRQDREALKHFECTPPATQVKRSGRSVEHHEARWELVAQRGIRNLRPPARGGRMILLGLDEQGIAAAASTEQVNGPADVFVNVLAVASRYRKQGGGIADELLDELISRLVSRADAVGETRLIVSGKVHVKNDPSRKLCERAGWFVFGDVHCEYQEWVLPIEF